MARFKVFVSHSSPTEKQPKKSVPLTLIAKINLNAKLFQQIPRSALKRLIETGNQRDVKRIVADGIKREYARSGLKKRSGRLLRDATNNFSVNIKLVGRQIRITLVWDPKTAYFLAHALGVKIPITPKMRVFLHANDIIHPRASTEFVKIPRRNFLSFKRTVRDRLIKEVFRPRLGSEIEQREDIQKAKQLREKAKKLRGRTLSSFRARRIGLTREQSRDLREAEALLLSAQELVESTTQGFSMEAV